MKMMRKMMMMIMKRQRSTEAARLNLAVEPYIVLRELP